MSDSRSSIRKSFKCRFIGLTRGEIVGLAVLLVILIAVASIVPAHRWGDASTYYMQVQSIVFDQDIRYTPQDIERIVQHPFEDTPAGLFLIKTPDGHYFYGKDFSYALISTPFFILFGNNGFAVFNALMFFGMIFMGYLYLRRDNGPYSLAYSAIFFLLSAYFVYVFWIHADIYNVFLIMLGLFLWSAYTRLGDRRFLIISSLVLGLAVVAKAPNAVIFLPLALLELYRRRYWNLLAAIGAFLVPVLLFTGLYYLQTGSISYYGGDRYYYNGQYPFLEGYDATHEAGRPAFSVNSGETVDFNLNVNNPIIIPYNLIYYFIGRFTGILWYFPFAVFSLCAFLWDTRKPDRIENLPEKLCVLAAIALFILTFITLVGNNYGGNQLGNRYFYVYPAFIFLLGQVDVKKASVFLLIALFTVAPLVAHPVASSTYSGIHPDGIPYRYFPLEYSQITQIPIAAMYYDYQGQTLMVSGDMPAYANDTFILGKDTKMTILSLRPLSQIKLALMSYTDSTASIRLGALTRETRAGSVSNTTVILDGVPPVYQDKRYFIYEVTVDFKPA